MSELLLVNPRRAKRRTHKRRAKRPMTALQRKYFGKGRKRRHHSAEILSANPAPKRHRRRRAGGKRRAVATRLRSRAQRLRGFNLRSFLSDTLVPSAIGAAGALGADVVLGYATPYLPSFLTTGIGAPVTKIAGAVALGAVAGMVSNRRVGEQVMAGAVTVVLYSYLKSQVAAAMPSLKLGYAGPALAYPDQLHGMGYYVSDKPAVPPAVVAAIAANAAQAAVGKTAPAAQTVGEYVSGYERDYMY